MSHLRAYIVKIGLLLNKWLICDVTYVQDRGQMNVR